MNRYLEPMRGLHTFIRAMPHFLAAMPSAHVVVVGTDSGPAYGPGPAGGGTWKDAMIAEIADKVDLKRIHFVGRIPYEVLIGLLGVSTAHIYLTYPFVPSWSLLDAMACECLVLGSNTAPVREIIEDGRNGLLVDFFDHRALADRLVEVCTSPDAYGDIRRAARQTIVDRFDRNRVCLPAWKSLLAETMLGWQNSS